MADSEMAALVSKQMEDCDDRHHQMEENRSTIVHDSLDHPENSSSANLSKRRTWTYFGGVVSFFRKPFIQSLCLWFLVGVIAGTFAVRFPIPFTDIFTVDVSIPFTDIFAVDVSIPITDIYNALFPIPFTDIFTGAELIIQSLVEVIQLFNFKVGPVTIFLSPLSLCPYRLPDWVPLKQSYLAITVMDFQVPWDILFVNLHMYPSVLLYLPSLSSSSFLHSFTLSVSLVSASVMSVPVELLGVCAYSPVWSLLRLSLSDAKIRLMILPGIVRQSFRTSAPLSTTEVPDTEPSISFTDTVTVDAHPVTDNFLETTNTPASIQGYLVSTLLSLWLLASRSRGF